MSVPVFRLKMLLRLFLPVGVCRRLRDWWVVWRYRQKRGGGFFRRRSFRPGDLLATESGDDFPVRTESGERRLKILLAAPWLIIGGADSMLVDWFRELDGDWCEKYLVTTLPRENVWLEKITGFAAGVYDLPAAGCLTQDAITGFLLECIAVRGIDILHIMNSEAAYCALPRLKERFPALKVVAQFHCFDYLADGRPAGFAYDIPPRYDHLIDCYNLEYEGLGREIRALYPGLAAGKFRVVHGRVDCDYYDPERSLPRPEVAALRRPGVLNLLFIGRLDRQKQPLRLLEVVVALRDRGVPCFLHVIGDGNLESQKKRFLRGVQKYRLENLVCWYGEQPLESLYDWYRIADALILTSDWEGVPMVLYQALAMQVVPVTAAVGGCGELVTPECGFLVTPPQHVAGYVEALICLTDPARREAMGRAGRLRMQSYFNLDGLDRDYYNLYREL